MGKRDGEGVSGMGLRGTAHLRSVLLQPLLLPDDVLQVLDGGGHRGVHVHQVVGGDEVLAAQQPLVEGQPQGEVQLRAERNARATLGQRLRNVRRNAPTTEESAVQRRSNVTATSPNVGRNGSAIKESRAATSQQRKSHVTPTLEQRLGSVTSNGTHDREESATSPQRYSHISETSESTVRPSRKGRAPKLRV